MSWNEKPLSIQIPPQEKEKKTPRQKLHLTYEEKEYDFDKILIHLVEGDANPEYTPELFYDVFLTQVAARQQIDKHPDVFHDYLGKNQMECPSCKERKELGFQTSSAEKKTWKTKKWVVGFDMDLVQEENDAGIQIGGNPSGVFIKASQEGEFSDRDTDMMCGDLSVREYLCPRCSYWKIHWKE